MTPDEGLPIPSHVDEFLASPKLVAAIENDRYRHLLDSVPVAIAVSRGPRDDQRIAYANQAFATLMGMAAADVEGRDWSCLDHFVNENADAEPLGAAIRAGEDFLGVFRPQATGRHLVVQAYAALIDSDDSTDSFRIAAMVDVGGRERSQIEQFEAQIRDRDMLLRELQHRVKNNLQLVTALVRLEARSAAEGEKVALARLASRIDALTVLYRTLSADDALTDIDLGQYLSDISTAVFAANAATGVELDLQVGYCPLSINVAMPAGLLVNEMLTNSLKYAFIGRAGGRVKLICKLEAGRITVVVGDDGVGLDDGQSWPSPRKLGALILQTLKENARNVVFNAETIRGRGTFFTISFDATTTVAPN